MERFHIYNKTTERDMECFRCGRELPDGTKAVAVAGFGEPFCTESCAKAQVGAG
jgi:hypothetical protein